MGKPAAVKSILDKSFKYTPSAWTDVRKTFRRERARLAALRAAGEQAAREASRKVSPLRIPRKTTPTL